MVLDINYYTKYQFSFHLKREVGHLYKIGKYTYYLIHCVPLKSSGR